jgi:hypothetical protein
MEILKKPPTKPDISNPELDAAAPTKRLYSSTVSGPERSVLVVEKGSDVKAVETVIVDNFIHVDQTSVNKSDGASVYVCKSKKDRNDLQEKLLQKYPEIKTRKPAELLPTISIAYLKYSMTEEELKTALTLREPGLKKLVDAGEMFNVNKVKPHKKNDSFYQATIRVSTEIRKFIAFELNNRLYLGANSYPVFDRFHVKRCDKCHRFNHYEEACTARLIRLHVVTVLATMYLASALTPGNEASIPAATTASIPPKTRKHSIRTMHFPSIVLRISTNKTSSEETSTTTPRFQKTCKDNSGTNSDYFQ